MKPSRFLVRHFGCRTQDPTLDISPNFVKRKKSILPPLLRFQLPRVTRVYQGLPGVTRGYRGLPRVTAGYRGLPRVTTGYHGLPRVTTGYPPGYPPGYLPSYPPGYPTSYLMLPNLTNHYIKLSKCRTMVRMKFGHFMEQNCRHCIPAATTD